MFGRATITLGIGPHSIFVFILSCSSFVSRVNVCFCCVRFIFFSKSKRFSRKNVSEVSFLC